MQVKHLLLTTAACLAVASAAAVVAHAEPGLSGQVTGAGGLMEGVLVTAKKNGSAIAYTVVSDAEGRYSFPAGKIEGGEYTLRIRATGYDLEGANRDGAGQNPDNGRTHLGCRFKPARRPPAAWTARRWSPFPKIAAC